LFCFSFISAAAHVKQNAETNSTMGAACQASLAVDLNSGAGGHAPAKLDDLINIS